MKIEIDLVSDTATLPTPEMREAIAKASVGDEQRGEDPSTRELCAMVANLLGKEAAVFLPSGVMCNQIAIATLCRPGDEILADVTAHIVEPEGGAAILNNVTVRTIAGVRGIYTAEQVESGIRPVDNRSPKTQLLVIEQTTNRGGGAIWSMDNIEAVTSVARRHGIASHMDGARLINAVVQSGVPAKFFSQYVDSVWIDLSKGLGAPVGAVLAGSESYIKHCWFWKHRLGGAMRQSGILAAAGIYALQNHVDRLIDDHNNARALAKLIKAIPGIRLAWDDIETNLVFFDVENTGYTAKDISERLLTHGVRVGVVSEYGMRAVTHLGIKTSDIKNTGIALAEACA